MEQKNKKLNLKEELPFMSQLTQNAETGSVNLKEDGSDSTEVTATPLKVHSLDQTIHKNNGLPKMVGDLRSLLQTGQTEFNQCTFNFNFSGM